MKQTIVILHIPQFDDLAQVIEAMKTMLEEAGIYSYVVDGYIASDHQMTVTNPFPDMPKPLSLESGEAESEPTEHKALTAVDKEVLASLLEDVVYDPNGAHGLTIHHRFKNPRNRLDRLVDAGYLIREVITPNGRLNPVSIYRKKTDYVKPVEANESDKGAPVG